MGVKVRVTKLGGEPNGKQEYNDPRYRPLSRKGGGSLSQRSDKEGGYPYITPAQK